MKNSRPDDSARPREPIAGRSAVLENPFAPPQHVDQARHRPTDPADEVPRRSWLTSLGIWTLVCVLSALPSFFWGYGTIAQEKMAAMSLGIATFICLYTLGDQWSQQHHWRRQRALRLALKIGYITRMVISVVFPVGGFLDLWCGLLSVNIAVHTLPWLPPGLDLPHSADFLTVWAITMIQGCVLNVVVAAFVLLVWGLIVIVTKLRLS